MLILEKTTLRAVVLFEWVLFQFLNLGPQLLHGPILGIFGLPGPLPVPLLQGKPTTVFRN
jgi:hypothetical protein